MVLASIATGVLVTSLAMAGPGNVTNTMHNFSAGNPGAYVYRGTTINEVCKFCHTPHNAGQDGRLLWNKANRETPGFYRLYTSSSTLSNTVRRNSSFSADSPSLLCLGCHDGKTAMNVLHSSSSGVDASGDGYPAGSKYIPTDSGPGPLTMPWQQPDIMNPGSMIPNRNIGGTADDPTRGNDLTNDHPLGFNYDLAQQEKPAALYSLAQVAVNSSNKIRFFGAQKKVECTTCHDPHVDSNVYPDLKPFLVMSNTGSALCLSCHNK